MSAPETRDALAEARRLMTICNACRYCEGLCAVFPAMEMRRVFTDGDLTYLADLCHGCGACHDDCQFAPPHEFAVSVPLTMARVRRDAYQARAWPRALGGLFAHNGLAISAIVTLSIAAFLLGFALANGRASLLAARTGPGAFYALMPHAVLALLFSAALFYAIVALALGVRASWHGGAGNIAPAALWQALKDAATLRYLDGGRHDDGGWGCAEDEAVRPDRRRLWHHATAYGFLLCFAATSAGTLYHYVLGREAPYPWYDLPVLLGTLGGIGLVAGPLGLLAERRRRSPARRDAASQGMDLAFIAMLLASAVTGLALLVLRATPAMGPLLALHLGVIFALFVTMPYGKFVHAAYRFAALTRYAAERRAAVTRNE